MNREDMLAGLIAQAALDGGDLVTLRAIVEEASEVGAGRALARLGLSDEAAQDTSTSCASCSARGARPRRARGRRRSSGSCARCSRCC